MKKLNFRKITVASMVGLCFWVAFERVHDFYVENIPLGYVGDCYDIRYPDFKLHYQMRIADNDNQEHKSFVTISLLNDPTQYWTDQYSYFQLRMLNPKKMECQ